MHLLHIGLLFLGLICFVLAAGGMQNPRVQFGWLGLVFWLVDELLAAIGKLGAGG
jgi:hypothetical protein